MSVKFGYVNWISWAVRDKAYFLLFCTFLPSRWHFCNQFLSFIWNKSHFNQAVLVLIRGWCKSWVVFIKQFYSSKWRRANFSRLCPFPIRIQMCSWQHSPFLMNTWFVPDYSITSITPLSYLPLFYVMILTFR